ncbi:GTPase Era [Candidatus Vallotia tarda]|uniref:GTPase Era n=1 Tax=Candidatus Vallotiella hemipterorum TaxID=1177213 RepID=A0A916NLC4_9BURK|nr:GTPase Era [Candidatus Vallotia tarda]CAG7598652.1 GTPase Era [Candidatus Vallotia tarda]
MNFTLEPTGFRCGTVAIVGCPNVGKSTLINALVGQKISITSRKAHTTRHRIIGIRTLDNAQFIFSDTPGFQTQGSPILNHTLMSTLASVDIVLFVIEAGRYGLNECRVQQLIPKTAKVILIVNKLDKLSDRSALLEFLKRTSTLCMFPDIIPMSARRMADITRLLAILKSFLPLGKSIYHKNELTNHSERFLAAEILREKIFRWTGDELPYTSTVLIDKFEQKNRLRRVFATILVDRNNHKAMIIGQKGKKLKQINTEARISMTKLFNAPVYLETFVKIKSVGIDIKARLNAHEYKWGADDSSR